MQCTPCGGEQFTKAGRDRQGRRNTAAARTFFQPAIATADVTPMRVTTDTAKRYPTA